MECREGREVGEKESRRGGTKRKIGSEAGEAGWREQRGIGQCKLLSVVQNGSQCMLNSVNKFQNVVLVTNWKITLIFFWFPFQSSSVWGQGPTKTGGIPIWIIIRRLVFIFLFFFVNRFVCFFYTVFYHHHY